MKFLPLCILFTLGLSLSLSAQRSEKDTIITDVVERVESITQMLNKVNNTLRRGFDTTEIAEELPASENLLRTLNTSNLNDHRLVNIRSLYALQVILQEMEQVHQKWQKSLFVYSRTITDMSSQINNILHDTMLARLPKDPSLQVLYTYQISRLNKKWEQADTANSNSLRRIGLLQNRVALNYISITDMLDEVNFRLKTAEKHIWQREGKNLWDTRQADYAYPFSNTLSVSMQADLRVLNYYFQHNWDVHSLNIVLFVLFLAWLLTSILRIRKHHPDKDGIFSNTRYASHKPILTSLLFIFTMGPFFYTNSPMVFMVLLWLIQAACVTWIIKDESPVWLRWQWFLLIFLYTAYAFFNLMMQSSFEERWAQAFLQLATLAVCWWFLHMKRKSTVTLPPHTKPIVWITILMTAGAFICNLTGRVMLSKFLGMSAIFSLISAQALVTLVQLLLETFYLHIEASKANSRFAAYLDFNRMQHGLRSTLFIMATIAWFAILIRNLNIHNIIRDTTLTFLDADRKIGNTSFTFASIFIFLVVIWFAFLLSKVMIFLFGHQDPGGSVKKNRWSSAVLLLRLGVLAAGVLLAFAASGIPVDKLTIIIGALSVGIGFGLQNIVNNLVSGVILAFEKPVEIGDVIDIGNQHGTVREIGIRASRIATVDGSQIIVPNGDLLSQHITNWTLTSQLRRVELIIGVAYGSDLKKAAAILKELLQNQEGIQSAPAPLVLVHDLNDSSIDFRILFWADIGSWVLLKSALLLAIYDSFTAEGIEIPFPQQDVHLRNPPASN